MTEPGSERPHDEAAVDGRADAVDVGGLVGGEELPAFNAVVEEFLAA